LAKRATLLVALAAALCAPIAARANGDPASDYLLVQSVFLPFNAKIDANAKKRLDAVVRAAAKAGFRIRVAVIRAPYDLGTAFSLNRKPQRYARFLGLELSFVYRDRLLVVMPNGYGYSVGGRRDPKAERVLRAVPPPGADVTKEADGAIVAIERLGAAAGHRIVVAGSAGSNGSTARDRITIAAAATAGIALLAAFVLYRRRREKPEA